MSIRTLPTCPPASLALAIGLLLASTAGVAAQATPKKLAVVVGVNKYHNGNFPTLGYAVNDAEVLGELLKKQGYDVRFITSNRSGKQAPTRENIVREIEKLCEEDAGEGDFIVIALAGHGLLIDNVSYFCPYNADPKKTDTMVSMDWISGELVKNDAKTKVIIVDACRKPRARAFDPGAVRIPDGVGILFGCASGQRTFEDDELRHGVFFYYVLKGLEGQAQNGAGQVTIASLMEYVGTEVPRRVKDKLKLPDQSPRLLGNLGAPSPVLLAASVTAATRLDLAKKEIHLDLGGVLLKMNRIDAKPGIIDQPLYIGVFEVTQAQYRLVTTKNPSAFQGDDLPVEKVSWSDATQFCEEATRRIRQTTMRNDLVVDLPTDREWVYCCRANAPAKKLTPEDANFMDAGKGKKFTTKGETFPPNGFGLYDMLGNVWEWCKDEDADNKGWRVLRGGCYSSKASECSADDDARSDKLERNRDGYGFRVVLRLSP